MTGEPTGGPPAGPVGDAAALTERLVALEHAVAELKRRLADLAGDASRSPAEPVLANRPAPLHHPGQPLSRVPSRVSLSDRIAERAHALDLETLIAGRWLNRVGLLAVAIGVAYFLRLAIDNEWIGPTGQVAVGLLLGSALLASTPWLLKRGYAYFADGLAGLGAAILYLSLWAAGDYYHLLSSPMTFAGMAIVTGGMMAMAVARSSQPIAVIALLGGFTAPALVDSPPDAHLMLFAYLAILNAGLLPLAWLRRWRTIDVPAFVLTELYFWGWFAGRYTSDQLTSTSAFAMLFFAMFLTLPVLRARTDGRTGWEHRVLVPANAYTLLAIGVAILWSDRRWTLTLLTLLLSAVHLVAARLVSVREGRPDARLLFGGVALTLATLAIPIRLEGAWTTLAWSIEGAVLVWTGFRTRTPSMRAMAFLLFAIAAWRVLNATALSLPAAHALLNVRFFVAMTTVLCLGVAVWVSRRHAPALDETERNAFAVLAVVLNVVAVLALTAEVRVFFRSSSSDASSLLAEGLFVSLLWAMYASGLMVFGVRQAIAGLRWQALILFGLTTLKVLIYDTASLSGLYRVASSIALGLVLLVVSFTYQRSLKSGKPENAA